MTPTSFGSGIESYEGEFPPAPSTAAEVPIEAPPVVPAPVVPEPNFDIPPGFDMDLLVQKVRASLISESEAMVADAERRLAQARELENSALRGTPRKVHTEDLNIGKHLVDGYTLNANTPTPGFIQWSSLHVVLLGVDYTIQNSSTDKKYSWFIKPGGTYVPGTQIALLKGDTLPVLGPNDALIFVNNGGVPVSALETSVSYAVGPGVIGDAQLASEVKSVLDTLAANDIAQQSALDGAITTHYQNDPPWPAGSPSPLGGNVQQGDVWYDSNDNGAYRWTGATPGAGITANSWQKIADTDTSALAGQINTKTTTYLRNNATPPVAPAGGFTTGDLWMVLDMNNLLRRWSGPAGSPANTWQDLQLGDAALAGIAGNKVGTGINASNITAGSLLGSLVGTGISPANLTGAGQVPIGGIPILGPTRLNTAFHMLY